MSSLSSNQRARIYARLMVEFDGRCVYCRKQVRPGGKQHGPGFATVDHDLPRSRGGTHAPDNTVLTCEPCNHAKADMTGPEFQSFLATGHYTASYIEHLEARSRKLLGHLLRPK